jgi:PAS domain-containing protein
MQRPAPAGALTLAAMSISRDAAIARPLQKPGAARVRATGESASPEALDDAVVTISPDGRCLAASPAALELLGVRLDELRAGDVGALVPGTFGDAARESWRVWVASGMALARGEKEIVQPGGRRVRVMFETVRRADGMYDETLVALPGNPDRRRPNTTLAAVLEAVREAERALAELPKRSRRRRALRTDIGQLREAFEQIVRSRMW